MTFIGNIAEVDATPPTPVSGQLTDAERAWMRGYEKSLNRRAEVEHALRDVWRGKRGPLTPDECLILANKLSMDATP